MALLRRISKFHIAMVTTFFVILMYIAREIQNTHHQPPGGYPDLPSNVNKRQQPSPNYHDSDPEGMVHFKKDVPLIWIGGVPRSGTTLMRAMLDAHPDIRCGEETRVIPRILGMHVGMSKTPIEVTRLQEAKITNEILDSAMGAYILSIIAMHGEPAPRLCNKDPFTLRSMQRLLKIFPNSKFIFMVRDGRATVHSIISRKVTIKGFDNHSYRGGLRDWNRAISTMHGECLAVGTSRCLLVHYEQLVLHPEAELRRVLDFLDVSWNEVVLHHEKTIGQTGGVSLSKKELSTDQVDKPVNLGALTKWIDYIPLDVRGEMRSLAPMLETLGYNPDAYPPFYGTPDKSVLKQSEALNLNKPPGPNVTPPEKDTVIGDRKNLPEEAHFAMGNRERL